MVFFSGADLEALDDDAIGDDNVTDEAQYEEAFAKMKKSSGVSDIDEVVRRFETQEETSGHLQEICTKYLSTVHTRTLNIAWHTQYL